MTHWGVLTWSWAGGSNEWLCMHQTSPSSRVSPCLFLSLIHTCTCTCTCTCTHARVRACAHTRLWCVNWHLCIHQFLCFYMHECLPQLSHTCMYIYIYVYTYIYIHVCTYIYVYICIYMHLYTHVSIFIYMKGAGGRLSSHSNILSYPLPHWRRSSSSSSPMHSHT